MKPEAARPLALTRAWFHGWCQCGSSALQLVDTWPQLPYTVCADCGHIAPHVFGTYYALHDTENGRHYLGYRSMEWPFYMASDRMPRLRERSVWARINERNRAGGVPN